MDNHAVELAPLKGLKPHPRNYRDHPEDQLEHIRASIEEHGFYRNVVTAKDGTILAGHGVVEACKSLGLKKVPIVRLPIEPDSPQAIKVLTGDNAIGGLAQDDTRALANILQGLMDAGNLLGTGYDDDMVAVLSHMSDSIDDLDKFDPNAEWAGMPEYTNQDLSPVRQVIVSFASGDDVAAFAELTETRISDKTKSVWFPPQERMVAKDKVYDAE